MKTISGTKSHSIDEKPEPRILPSFSLASTDLPAIKSLKIGEVIFLKVKAEIVKISKGENEWGGDNREKTDKRNGRFQMRGIELINEKESFGDEYTRKRAKANK